MKTISNAFSYLPIRIMAIVTAATIAIITSLTVLAAGPPVLTWTGDTTAGGDQVQFNAFENNPVWGDERDFVRGSVDGRDATKTDPVNDVRDGDVVDVVVFVHNVIDAKYNESGDGIARNTRVAVQLPEGKSQSQAITATVSADNTPYGPVTDTVTINSDGNYELEPVAGSARINSNSVTDQSIDINALINGGVNIGDIAGCFEYIHYISFKVKVNMPNYEIQKEVREEGSGPGNWKNLIDVEIGDKVEWSIGFSNIGSTVLQDVKIVDQIPAGHKVVPGSIQIRDFTYPDSAIQANSTQINVDIADYAPNSRSFLYFTTEVVDNEAFECGAIRVQNVAYATPEGYGAVNDSAFTVIDTGRTCEEQSLTCDSLTATPLTQFVDETVTFTTAATATNGATITNYDYSFGDGETAISSETATHKYTTAGTYTATVDVNGVLDGNNTTVTSPACEVTVTVEEEPVDPVFTCDALNASSTLIKVGDSVDFTIDTTATPSDRVSADSFELLVNDVAVNESAAADESISLTFTATGSYKISADVSFTVDGETKVVSAPVCEENITVEEEPADPIYECVSFVADKSTILAGESVNYTVTARAENGAVVSSYDVTYGDGAEETVTSSDETATVSHTYTEAGKYAAGAKVNFTVDGETKTVSDNACVTMIEVEEEPEEPVYKCVAITATPLASVLSARIMVTTFAANGASATQISFDYGDNTAPFVTNNFVDGENGQKTVTVDHEYAEAGEYSITATVSFNVNGETETVTCVTQVEVEEEPEVCEFNSELTPNDPNCKEDEKPETPAVLPNTGAGSLLFGIFGTSAIGTMIRSWLSSRRTLTSALRG